MSMEGIQHKGEGVPKLAFQKANEADIAELIAVEKSIGDIHTYSSMVEEGEWKDELQSNDIFLIKEGDRVVGSISYEEKSPEHLYISGVVVRPEFQGKGIARTALQKVLNEHAHVPRIDLVTHPDNPARRLYESLGFVIESRQENYWGEGEPRLVLVHKRS